MKVNPVSHHIALTSCVFVTELEKHFSLLDYSGSTVFCWRLVRVLSLTLLSDWSSTLKNNSKLKTSSGMLVPRLGSLSGSWCQYKAVTMGGSSRVSADLVSNTSDSSFNSNNDDSSEPCPHSWDEGTQETGHTHQGHINYKIQYEVRKTGHRAAFIKDWRLSFMLHHTTVYMWVWDIT